MGFKDWVSIFIMLVPAFMFAFIKDYTAMGIFAGISFATILIINLNQLKYISAFGLKAGLKESIDKLNVSMEQLQELQEISCEAILNLIETRQNIFSTNVPNNVQIIDKICKHSKKINTFESIKEKIKQCVSQLLFSTLENCLRAIKTVDCDLKIEKEQYIKLLQESNDIFLNLIPIDVMLKLIKDKNNEFIKDYKLILNLVTNNEISEMKWMEIFKNGKE